MTDLRAFHGDPAIKEKYLDRVRWHREMDHLVQGVGWESNGTTRGCAIGCTLEAYDCALYPVKIGLPEWIAHLEDRIFEGLPRKDALAWPERFLSAIPVGADLEPVRCKLAIRRMDRLIDLQRNVLVVATTGHGVRGALEQTITALQAVRSCHDAEIGGDTCNIDSAAESARSALQSAVWSAAESAVWSARSAESAAESAQSALRSALRSAVWSALRSAVWSAAESAESAAQSAVWSARSAVWSAAESAVWSAPSARSAAWRQEADDLIALLEEIKL